MDVLRLLRVMMGLAITGEQDIGVSDGSGGKKLPGFLEDLEKQGLEGAGKRQ